MYHVLLNSTDSKTHCSHLNKGQTKNIYISISKYLLFPKFLALYVAVRLSFGSTFPQLYS